MAETHADRHDLDKLERWSASLSAAETPGFPVYAVFLVTPEDRYAHDVFRAFRSSFGDLGADFQHLVIFGQHGVSTTVRGLMAGLGLPEESLPLLALFSGPAAREAQVLSLAKGDSGQGAPEESWRGILDWVGDGQGRVLGPAAVAGLESHTLSAGPLADLAAGLLAG